MKIRTQLILASFVLAVLPLAAIVIWSYHSSRQALETVYRSESRRLASGMERRLGNIRAELEQRLAVVSALPLQNAELEGRDEQVVGNIVKAMGPVASLVDSLEFKPVPQPPSPAPQTARTETAPEVARAEATPQVAATPAPAPQPASESSEARAALAPAPGARFKVVQVGQSAFGERQVTIGREQLVIQIPPAPEFPKYVLPAEHEELVREIARVSLELRTNKSLSPEEKAELQVELETAGRELDQVMHETARNFSRQMQEANEAERQRRQEITRQIAEAREKQRRLRAEGRPAAPVSPGAPPPTPAAAEVAAASPPPAEAPAVAAAPAQSGSAKRPATESNVRVVGKATAAENARTTEDRKQLSLIFGPGLEAPVRREGAVVGQLSAKVRTEEIVARVLGQPGDGDEIPFAIDREGTVYARTPQDRAKLEQLGVPQRLAAGQALDGIPGWIVTASTDKPSGMRIGVARPMSANFDRLRQTAARNFVLGLGLIFFALIGIVPLANHLTRDVELVTAGAQRVAHGDLMTRLPVKSNNEFGQLALAFNRMAEDLSLQQQKLVEGERARKEQEIHQRVLAVEYERKSVELEDARRFQLSMLPKHVPQDDRFEVAVYTRTATEVGGDYYDFHLSKDGVMTVAIGDATGHGAKAGTMVTVVKTLFAGYDGTTAPAEFLGDAAERIKRMELGRMSMALGLARLEGRRLTVATAGMPPVLVHHANGSVDEIALEATPLGTLGTEYAEVTVKVGAGDTILFMTDGFPELLNDAGQQYGYVAAQEAFTAAAAEATAEQVVARLVAAASSWHGEQPPNDDVTFVVVRVR